MKRILMVMMVLAVFAITGCDDSNSGGSGGTTGGGENLIDSQANTNGTSVTIPESVTVSRLDGDTTAQMAAMDPTALTEYISCMNACDADRATSTDQEYMDCMMACVNDSGFVSEGAFTIAISLTNSGSSSEDVILHAGTVFSPDSGDYQPMMIIEDITLTVTPGTQSFMLPVYCLAPDLSAPDSTNGYTITGLTDNTCLNAILDILATKNIDSFSYANTGTVQDAIWNCVTGEYGPADTAALNALP